MPVHRIRADHADKVGHNVTAGLLPKILTGACVEDRDAKVAGGNVDIGEILLEVLDRLCEVRAVEWCSNGKEAVDKADLAVGIGNACLVKTSGRLELAELKVQTVE
jgi:hypothetical protein